MTARQKARALFVVCAVVLATVGGSVAFSGAVAGTNDNLTVDPDGNADHTAIQAAVDNASDAQTVKLLPADNGYSTNVVIDKNITIVAPQGANLTNATGDPIIKIDSPDNSPIAPTIRNVTLNATGEAKALVVSSGSESKEDLSNGGDWTLNNVTINGSGAFKDVFLSGASGDWEISSSIIHNTQIRSYEATGNWVVTNSTFRGSEIEARFGSVSDGNWTVKDTRFKTTPENNAGIEARNSQTGTVSNVTFRGNATGNDKYVVLYIGGGTVEDVVMRNRARNFDGIFIDQDQNINSPPSLKFENLTLEDFAEGKAIRLSGDDHYLSTIEIANSTIRNSGSLRLDDKSLDADVRIRDTIFDNAKTFALVDRSASDYTLTNVTFKNISDTAVLDLNSPINPGSVWQITDSKFVNIDREAFRLKEGSVEDTERSSIKNTVIVNSGAPSGRTLEVSLDPTVPPLDATGNWWGDASGPAQNACQGNVICDDPLTYNPTEPLVATDGSAEYATVTDAVSNATAGETILVGSGTYNESLSISKNITIVGESGTVIQNDSTVSTSAGIELSTGGGLVAPAIQGVTIDGFDTGISATDSTGSTDATGGGNWTATDVVVTNATTAVDARNTTGEWTVDGLSAKNVTGAALNATDSRGNWTLKGSTLTDVTAPHGAIDARALTSQTGNWTVDGVSITNTDGTAIEASAAQGQSSGAWTVKNTNVQNVPVGVDATYADSEWTVTGATITNTTTGIRAEETDGNWTVTDTDIVDAQIDEANITGVDTGDSTGDWRVERLTVENISSVNGSIAGVDTNGVDATNGVGATDEPATGNWTVADTTISGLNSSAEKVKGIDAAEGEGLWTVSNATVTDLQTNGSTVTGIDASESRTGGWLVTQSEVSNLSIGSGGSFNLIGINAEASSEAEQLPWKINETVIQDLDHKARSGTTNGIRVGHNPGPNWSITDVTVRNLRGSSASAVSAPGKLEAPNPSITDVVVYGVEATGFPEFSAAVRIEESPSDLSVRNVTVSNTNVPGIDASDSTGNWSVSRSTFENATRPAIDGNQSTGDWSVSFTTLNDTQTGVIANGSAGDWTVTNTRVTNASATGVVGTDTTGAWSVTDSLIRDTGASAINATGAQIEGNASTTNITVSTGDRCVGNVSCKANVPAPSAAGDLNQAIVSAAVTHLDGTQPDMANVSVDARNAGGLTRIQLKNATAIQDTNTEDDKELAGVGADNTSEMRISVTTLGETPRALIGNGRNVSWTRTQNDDGTWTVTIEGKPTAVESYFVSGGSPPRSWTGDRTANESQDAAMTFEIDSLSVMTKTRQETLNGSVFVTDAQEFESPVYNDGGTTGDISDDQIDMTVAAPHFTAEGKNNTGYFTATLPQAQLDAWGVTADQLQGLLDGTSRKTDVTNTNGGATVSFDVQYSEATASVGFTTGGGNDNNLPNGSEENNQSPDNNSPANNNPGSASVSGSTNDDDDDDDRGSSGGGSSASSVGPRVSVESVPERAEPRDETSVSGQTGQSDGRESAAVTIENVRAGDRISVDLAEAQTSVDESATETQASAETGAEPDTPAEQTRDRKSIIADGIDLSVNADGDYDLTVTTREESIGVVPTTPAPTTEAQQQVGEEETGGVVTGDLLSTESLSETGRDFAETTNRRPVGYIEVEHDFSDANLDGVTHEFRVRKSYLEQTGATAETVQLYRDEPDVYRPLPTRLTGETESFYEFEADAPGLSLFVISTESPIFESQDPSLVSTDQATGSVVATVSVKNVGNRSGTYTAQLIGDGEPIGTTAAEIPRGESTTVRVTGTVEKDEPISLRLANTSIGTFERASPESPTATEDGVSGETTTSTDDTPTEESADDGRGGIPASIIIIVAVIGGGLLVFALRRQNE